MLATSQNMPRTLLALTLLVILFFQPPLLDSNARRTKQPRNNLRFASAATTAAAARRRATMTGPNDCSSTPISKEYNVYVVVTPFENTIGRAVAQELAQQLSSEANPTAKTRKESVICLVRFPPNKSNAANEISENPSSSLQSKVLQKLKTWGNDFYSYVTTTRTSNDTVEEGNNAWLDQCSKASSIPVLSSSGTGDPATEFVLDPFGDAYSIRKSCETCLARIRKELLRRVALEAFSDKGKELHTDSAIGKNSPENDCHQVSATIHLRGILFNPYGCPPPRALESMRSNPTESADNRDRVSPLAAYKLLSIAMFVDAAMASQTTTLQLSLPEFLRKEEPKEAILGSQPFPLRIILVGSEAARGLPKMGIPVPELQGATESTIRTKLLCAPTDSESSSSSSSTSWESDYAEMNALAVLYLKALELSLMSQIVPSRDSAEDDAPNGEKNLYVGVVSPGMTPESFNIGNVPESARTLAFSIKLWLCRRPWVFDSLQKSEIAKTTQEAAELLTKALLNGPMVEATPTTDAECSSKTTTDPNLQWDDVYPSGSFVGAQSGTGGPLCEQSLLLYDPTNNKVGLGVGTDTETARDDIGSHGDAETEGVDSTSDKGPTKEMLSNTNHERINFLGDRRLQELVYRVVREIISNSTN